MEPFSKQTELALVTANVGSIFELPEKLLDQWISSFVEDVIGSHETVPTFVALHCQEVGGKHFGQGMPQVDLFVKSLSQKMSEHGFDRCVAFIDKVIETFTALGSIYFINQSAEVQIWNFDASRFEPVTESKNYDDLESTPLIHKHKFSADMTPQQRASRKGFLRARFQFSQGPSIEFVNVHLFHDESNFVAMQAFPSTYMEVRRNALEFTLERIGQNDRECPQQKQQQLTSKCPFFIFGDFNFRLDTGAVVSWLSEGAELLETKDEEGKLMLQQFNEIGAHDSETRTILSLGRKTFNIHNEKTNNFLNCDLTRKKLFSHDKELEFFNKELHEFDIEFPPSYPYSEDVSQGTSFGSSRCPAWCDRVLFNDDAESLGLTKIQYDLIGKNLCMGDHKPVLLRLKVGGKTDKGAGDYAIQTGEGDKNQTKANGKRRSPKTLTGEIADTVHIDSQRQNTRKKINCWPSKKKCIIM